jgi:hypothetical protein
MERFLSEKGGTTYYGLFKTAPAHLEGPYEMEPVILFQANYMLCPLSITLFQAGYLLCQSVSL